MRNHELPFELIDIYNQKMLADRVKLALMRVKRENMVSEREKKIFTRLAAFLQAASEGDRVISSSQMKASNEQSLQALRETLMALRGMFQETESFRNWLNELVQATNMLSEGRLPSLEAQAKLMEFVQKYSAIQAESIREPQVISSGEAITWPLIGRTSYSSTP